MAFDVPIILKSAPIVEPDGGDIAAPSKPPKARHQIMFGIRHKLARWFCMRNAAERPGVKV